MSVHFIRNNIKQNEEIVNKLYSELVKNNGKENLVLVKKYNERLAIPYFYAKMLIKYEEKPFSDALIEEMNGEEDKEELPLNLRSQHKKVEFSRTYTLREKQIPILDEAERRIRRTGTIFIQACTGFGKSIAIAHLVQKLGYLAVLIFTRVGFIEQSAITFKKYTNAVVWIPSSRKKVPPNNVQVIITSPKRFVHIPQELKDQVGIFVIDEAPLICTPQGIDPILSLRPRYIIALSATLKRRDGMHIMIDMIVGPTKVIKGLDVPVRVIRWYTKTKIPYVQGVKGADWAEHSKFICSNENRNKMIARFVNKIITAPTSDSIDTLSILLRKISKRKVHKIAMMTNRVEDHIGLLQPLIKDQGITCDYLSADKKKYKDSSVVLGTGQKLGIGFDAELVAQEYDGEPIDVSFPLISTAQDDLVIQELGRACRVPDPHPAIFVIMIDDNNISRKHAKVAEKALSELSDIDFFNYYGDVD